MTPGQSKKAAAALKGKLTKPCPMCGVRAWQVAEIVTLFPFAGGDLIVGGNSVPVLLVACTSCTYLAPFSAVRLGLVGARKD